MCHQSIAQSKKTRPVYVFLQIAQNVSAQEEEKETVVQTCGSADRNSSASAIAELTNFFTTQTVSLTDIYFMRSKKIPSGWVVFKVGVEKKNYFFKK